MAGHINKLASGRWQARFPRPGGPGLFRTKSFDKKVDALRWLQSQNVARDRGTWTDPKEAATRFAVVADSWALSRRGKQTATRARDESVVRNWVLPFLGEMELRHISPEELDAWVHHLDEVEGKAPATVRKAFNLASQILDRAVATGKIPINPAKVKNVIEMPKATNAEMRVITPDEIDLLATVIDDRYRALVLTAAYASLRWAELIGLRRSRLDLEGRRIHVVETLTETRGVHEWKKPKTAASKRVVSINPMLCDVLGEHLERWPAIGNAPIFTGADGGLMRRSSFRQRHWLPAVRDSVRGHLRFHDLRHSSVAIMIEAGVHIKVIQARLGHADIGTTLNVYGHLFPGSDEAAADALEVVMAESMKHERSTDPMAKVAEIRSGKAK